MAPGDQLELRGHGWFADHDMSPIREMAGSAARREREGKLAEEKGRERETREKGMERWERRGCESEREVERRLGDESVEHHGLDAIGIIHGIYIGKHHQEEEVQ